MKKTKEFPNKRIKPAQTASSSRCQFNENKSKDSYSKDHHHPQPIIIPSLKSKSKKEANAGGVGSSSKMIYGNAPMTNREIKDNNNA